MSFSETADIETASDGYAARFAGPVGQYFLDVQARFTIELLAGFSGGSVLDVGGGHGQLTMPLANEGFRVTVTGSDDICRKRLDKYCDPGSFRYLTCDSLHLPFADNAFDVVLSFRLLPHADNWQGLLLEMCRVAGKAVVFDYPDRRSANIFYDLLFEMKRNLEGNTRTYRLFSRKEIAGALRAGGFSPSRFQPEFFFPMVLHRKMKNPRLSRMIEVFSRRMGMTHVLGSPIIVLSTPAR